MNEPIGEFDKLPGFDFGAVIDAMTCTGNAKFVCWRETIGESKTRFGRFRKGGAEQ